MSDFDFRSVLDESCISMELANESKDGIIGEMLDMLVAAGKIEDREAALAALLERERKMSTGMQCGVAIPHAKTESVPNLVTAFALKKRGVDFGALDGQPSCIFVMTLSSVLRTGPHMQFLAEISKLLSSATIRQKLVEAQSRADVLRILNSEL